jgi:DEAD/DEAH box helicase
MSSSFAELGVPSALASHLAARGFDAPFPIQAATLPDALAGRDVSGRAPTGSGKTLAFGLAIAARREVVAPRRPWALVLVPTRELAAPATSSSAGRSTRASTSSSPAPVASRTSSRAAPSSSATSVWPSSTRPTAWLTWVSSRP